MQRLRVSADEGGANGGAKPKWTIDQIVGALLDAVKQRRLPPGAKLPEEQLSRLFGTSRSNIRVAFRHLSAVGVVQVIPNRGAFVARPTPEEASQIYEARRLIEREIVADVAQHCTAADIRRLREHLRQQRQARDQGDRGEYIRLLGEFHLIIASFGGNAVLRELLGQLIARTSLLMALYVPDQKHSCSVEEHEALIDLLAAGDIDNAKWCMDSHLHATRETLAISEDRSHPHVDLATIFDYAGTRL
jgi:DNA-binding GntR family transcriptional regulator